MARHYGIPYMGSKQKLVDKIIPFIIKRHPNAKKFYDPFGGGASVSLYVVRKYPNFEVYYNELSTAIGGLVEYLQQGGEIPKEFVTRYIFESRYKDTDWYGGFLQTCWSFGNNQKSYIYGKDIQDFKELLHNIVTDQSDDFKTLNELIEKYAREHGVDYHPNIYIDPARYKTPYQRRIVFARQITHSKLGHIKILQHYPYLERLESIKLMPGIKRLHVSSGKSYKDIDIDPKNSIVYCDPPYENTAEYKEGGFNHKEFYDWASSREYPVYFTSYVITDKRFKVVKAINTLSMLAKAYSDKPTYNYENVYWNGVE